MGKTPKIISILSILFITGCVQNTPSLFQTNLNEDTQKPLTFKTNEHAFMTSLTSFSTLGDRNAYLDEFLLKSDMQCMNYLNKPLQKSEEDTNKNDSLYMSIADTVSTIFGVRLITDTAKAVFLNDDAESKEEKNAYANALSPEIRKGVEIGRTRYAKTMQSKKILSLEKYSINHLKEDTLKYDKQCNLEYGLTEINRALKVMQTQMNTPAISVKKEPTLSIDPKVIKEKVEQVTKEIKKKEENNSTKKIKQSDGNATVLSI